MIIQVLLSANYVGGPVESRPSGVRETRGSLPALAAQVVPLTYNNNDNNNDDDDDDNHNNDNDDDDDDDNNYDNTCIERRNSRFSIIPSLRRELSPTQTFKWLGRNRVQTTCNTSSAYHVQHVVLRATWYEGTAQLLRMTELKSHLF